MGQDLTEMPDIQLLRFWQSKALVCVCSDMPYPHATPCGGVVGVDWCGPQRTAMKALRELERRGIHPSEKAVALALSEDSSCGRRKHGSPTDFDALVDRHIADLEKHRGT